MARLGPNLMKGRGTYVPDNTVPFSFGLRKVLALFAKPRGWPRVAIASTLINPQ